MQLAASAPGANGQYPMDEEALLYEDDYEPEMEPEPADAVLHDGVPGVIGTFRLRTNLGNDWQ